MNKAIQEFNLGLELNNAIHENIINTNILLFDNISGFIDAYTEVYNKEKDKLPFHINLLDEIWANENAHSRIFKQILKFKRGNKYEILECFLKYLNIIDDCNLKINHPVISSEKMKIDVLIRDKAYAVIIENKIHYARDQESQIARYITKVKQLGYYDEQIYIVYLTRDNGKVINRQSWKYNKVDYKELYLDRFFHLSYKMDILPWLKKDILDICTKEDKYLESAIVQYIDYLEGLFNQRKIQTKMNAELKKHISSVLELNSTPENNLSKLEMKAKELEKVQSNLNELIISTEKECWNYWLLKFKADFPEFDIIDGINEKDYRKLGVLVEIRGYKFSALIEKHKESIYFGLGIHEASDDIEECVDDFLKPFIRGYKNNEWWYGYKYTSFKNAYVRINSLISEIIEK